MREKKFTKLSNTWQLIFSFRLMYPCSLIIAVRVSSNCATFSRLLSRSNTRTTRMNNASRLIASRPRRLADTTRVPRFFHPWKTLARAFFFFFFWKAACATQIYTDVIFELYYSNVNLKIVDTSHPIVSCNKVWKQVERYYFISVSIKWIEAKLLDSL